MFYIFIPVPEHPNLLFVLLYFNNCNTAGQAGLLAGFRRSLAAFSKSSLGEHLTHQLDQHIQAGK